VLWILSRGECLDFLPHQWRIVQPSCEFSLFQECPHNRLTLTGDPRSGITSSPESIRAVLLVAAQIGGACFAAYLVKVMYPTPLNVQTTLGGGVTIAQGLFIEAVCTAELVFTIIMLAKEKHRATFMVPIGIGFALFIGELVAVYSTGGSLNPARSFGPAAVLHSFDVHHWIYSVGPFIGTLLVVVFYRLIKILEYEMANPGQDGDFENDPTQNPNHEIAQVVEER
jgi:aquaporin related protein